MWTFHADERHKWITFLPDPALTDEQKRFLRMVFPAALMVEIDQRTANKILVESSLIATVTSRPPGLDHAVAFECCLREKLPAPFAG